MSNGNMLKKKKGITLPHIYILLFSIIVVCTILTWILPAGEFDRVVNEATGRTVAVAGTFHTVEQSPVEGSGHGYGAACGLVHHPVKLTGGEDPGEDGADNDDGKQQNIDVRQLDAFFLF